MQKDDNPAAVTSAASNGLTLDDATFEIHNSSNVSLGKVSHGSLCGAEGRQWIRVQTDIFGVGCERQIRQWTGFGNTKGLDSERKNQGINRLLLSTNL